MYQAIVFLPLLGAILAGIIALAGARARFPGEGPSGLDDHSAGHAHHAEADHGEAHDHAAGGHDEHHGPTETAAVGSRMTEVITTTFLMISFVLSWIAFVQVGFGHHTTRVEVFPWIVSGDLHIDWALRIDTLTAVMLVVVNTVSALVHLYSMGYMADDPYRPRFFGYLSFFTFAMLMLVTSDNLVQLFFGWEGVGLASYLLIGFWYTRPSAYAAAIKAFVVNRVGDFGFALGIFAVFLMTGSVAYDTVFAAAPALVHKTIPFFGWHPQAITAICLLLFMGAMGKSAQFLLHTWLPDAMEGPTPVSALIHAATMVTAGVFMVARLSPLFELSPAAQTFVMFIGGTTAVFAATIGLVQNDIKRVIAYSTCSQLGYMFIAMGAGAYSIGMFHLFTHAFFKALLFLGSGSVIVAMHHEQDMRKMGGLKDRIPLTYAAMVIGGLALTGFPLTAGYYSKDAIIEAAYAGHNPMAMYGYACGVFAALLTSFYTWRLIFMTFHGEPHDRQHWRDAHESPLTMLIPLGVLSVGALFAGFAFHSVFIGKGVEGFFGHALFFGANNHVMENMELMPKLLTFLPTLMMVIGFLVAWLFYIRRPDLPAELARQHRPLYLFLLNKWYFDELYDFIFVRPVKWLGYTLWKGGDGFIIDGFGPDGVSARVLDVTRNVVRLQTGYLYHYAFAMLIGAALFITWFMFAVH
ncbi:MAG: NADH-quinone oxidoreductase subunit L [Pseudolabrys sp.]